MTETGPTPPPETETELMEAVASVLYESGYSGLTLRKVAGETTKSKSLLQHYYGTKDRLVRAFLSYLIDDYVASVERIEAETPRARFESYLRWALGRGRDEEFWRLHAAMFELQVRARHDPALRERFLENYETVWATVVELIRDADVAPGGITDPETAATLVTAFVWASRVRAMIHGNDDALDEAARVLDALLPAFDL